MKITIRSNQKAVLRQVNRLRQNGARKAIASAETDTLFSVRKQAPRWWRQSVQARNARLMRAALRVDRARSATLIGSVFDSLGRAAISWQSTGGTRTGRGGRRAVPTRRVNAQRTAGGKIKASLRPSAKNVFREGDSLYKRTRGKVQKLYTLKKSVRQPRTFKFARRANRWAGKIFPKFLDRRLSRAVQRAR